MTPIFYYRIKINMIRCNVWKSLQQFGGVRPHFYQDVAYGNKIKLDSGEKIQMPNVVRTVARSTMINQYFEFCKEE